MGSIDLSKDTEDLFKKLADDGTLGGVYLAKPTGEVLEEDPTYLEVILGNKSFFAKPCFAFGSWNIPSKKWLEKYKDKIMVWVACENGNSAHLVYLGVQPLDEKTSDMPFMNGKNYTSTKYRYWIDDDNDEFRVERFDDKNKVTHTIAITPDGTEVLVGKNGVKINDNLVVVGNGSGKQSVIMGDKFVNDLAQILENILNDALIVVGTGATHSPAVKAQATTLRKTLSGALSKNVKIE